MPQARLIDGKVISAALRIQVAAAVAELGARHNLRPGLTVVQVGEDPASSIYVRNKGIATLESGMRSDTVHLPDDTTQAALLEVVRSLNADARVHGILVQFPVPPQISQRAVLAAIHPDKDVDGLTVVNAGRLASGEPGLVSCTPLGCMLLLREALGDLRGRRAVVLGRSNLVGKPVAQLLLAADCTVTVAHSRTADLPAVCREADVLVAAVGRPEMVRGDWIAPGAAVIDVGINRVPSRDPAKAAAGAMRVVGDVAFDEVREVAGWITPVPGGVGPMTIACLLRNTVTAACLQTGLPDPFAR